MVREIDSRIITDTVASLCIEANKILPPDIEQALKRAAETECAPLALSILGDIKANLKKASELDIPVCQDTGMAVIFAQIGQDVHITGELFEDAVNKGVKKGYEDGLLRKSIVADPLKRSNTGDNTPAVIHTRIVAGDKITITVAPKGFGSENMSRIYMLAPSAGVDGVKNSVLDAVKKASGNPCPPMVIGVGIGGDFEECALLSKRALCRSLDERNPEPYYRQLEEELLKEINDLGIGPQGFGGKTTAIGLNIETAPTHIAGLPVAVNVGCYVTRHKTAII